MSRQQRIRKAQRRAGLYGGDWRDHLKTTEVRAAVFYGDVPEDTEETEEDTWDSGDR